jgi:hypothetical protein
VSAGALLISLCVCGCSFCSTLRYEVQPALRIASATGTLQVPRGGDPKSSSGNRPGLEELGVGTTVQVGTGVRVRSGRAGLALDMRYLFLDGEGRAQGDLVSQGESFPSGSELESSSGLGSWRLTACYAFPLVQGLEDARDELSIVPRIGIEGITLHYAMATENGTHTDRSFTHFAPAVGGSLIWRPGGDWRFDLTGFTSFSFQGRDVVWNELELRFGRRIDDHLSVWIGVGFQQFRLRDSQPYPNRADVDFGPALGLGFEFGF